MGEPIPTVDRGDGGKPTIALRANTPRQKAEWERAAEQSGEYDSVSHLIKLAVSRELAGMYTSDMGNGSGISDHQLNEVLDTLESLEGEVGGLSEDIDEATTAMYASETTLSDETITTVYADLPVGPTQATTAQAVSARTDIDVDTASVALGQLAESHPAVKRLPFKDLGEAGDDGTVTATWNGREIPIEGARKAVKRRNPLYFKEE
ncbi:hypothetical protein [Halorubrum saccharovorum]|uniref:hypothetical protein n=1 Tax=Halorubrum saccharovorum TaxID=2248 RepID=UPI001267E801|nr:hypothetical protein [Halorubrum saccharovorum]